ncbi:MAG: flagellar filament capping protein FliD, partial [Pseudomonadota bacterium]
SAYSTLSKTIKSLTAYDSTSKSGSVLTGDGTTSLILSRLRTTLNTVPSGLTGTYATLAEVGIAIQADGSMSVNSTKLQSAIDGHFTDLQSTLGKYGAAISSFVTAMTDSAGTVTSRVNSLNNSVSSFEKKTLQLQSRLSTIEANYRRQYAALDASLGSMSVTSSFLTQQFARL